MKPIFKIGNWARTNSGFIGKIVELHGKGKDRYLTIETNIQNLAGSGMYRLNTYAKDVTKAHSKLIKILEKDDFIDTHCIWNIDKDTIYFNEGWFLHESDIMSLATTITTKEKFLQGSFIIEED